MLREMKNAGREHLGSGGALSRLYVQKGRHGAEDIVEKAKAAGASIGFCERKELDRLCGS